MQDSFQCRALNYKAINESVSNNYIYCNWPKIILKLQYTTKCTFPTGTIEFLL